PLKALAGHVVDDVDLALVLRRTRLHVLVAGLAVVLAVGPAPGRLAAVVRAGVVGALALALVALARLVVTLAAALLVHVLGQLLLRLLQLPQLLLHVFLLALAVELLHLLGGLGQLLAGLLVV